MLRNKIKLQDKGNDQSYRIIDENELQILLQEQKLKKQKEKEKQENLIKQAQIDPMTMFKDDSKFSEYDDKGIPIKDSEGKPLKEKFIIKMRKQQQKQEELRLKYL